MIFSGVFLAVILCSRIAAGHLVEIPYPRLHNGRSKLHIISERFDSKDGYSNQEEFVDFGVGKGAFIEQTANSKRTILTDASSHSTYVYRPYSCEGKQFPELPGPLPRSNESRFGEVSKMSTIGKGGDLNDWYLFGVTALWNRVEWFPKIFTSLDTKKSDEKYKWTVVDERFSVDLYFREMKAGSLKPVAKPWEISPSDSLLLSRIVLQTAGQDKRRTTINILSLDYELGEDVYRDQFQLPLMYGCQGLRKAAAAGAEEDEETKAKISAIERLGKEKYPHLKMEVSATKVVNVHDKPTDTMSLEFARSRHSDTRLRMIHQINSRQDVKLVIDYDLNVKYKIDRRRGSCEMVNSPASLTSATDEDVPLSKKLNVHFSNGLVWEFSDKMMDFLFYELDELELTRTTKQEGFEWIYFEGSEWNLTGRDRFARLVRKYSHWPDENRFELESATVWILDAGLKLKEIYHFNIVDSSLVLRTDAQEARLFDVSHECYLDNRQVMKYGRDFVWLQFHHPESQEHHLADIRDQLEQELYRSMRLAMGLSHFRVPKMEFLFDTEDGFTVRMLLLDTPPLHLIYDRAESYAVEPSEGDLVEIATTLEHCSDLCRLHRCEGMSFCSSDFSCVLTLTQDKLGAKMRGATDCVTLRKPKSFNADKYYDGKLSNVVARLQRLGNLAELLADLPKLPEDQSKDSKLLDEYTKSVEEYLEPTGLRGFSVVKYLNDEMLVLAPDRVELEIDPLATGLIESLKGDSQMLNFHKGIHGQRYSFRTFEGAGRRARRFAGVDFDQCSLACVDGGCSSFSHCRQRKECIITEIYDIKSSQDKHLQLDADCVIVQRDFLGKFNKFSAVQPSSMNKRATELVSNPSECAHTCVARSDFNCLAFTFCKQQSSCIYSDSRSLDKLEPAPGCDHFSRSYLADFTRHESRQIQENALAEMTTTSTTATVDRCAEMCATEQMDCSAFQFCYDAESQPSQQCIIIESSDKFIDTTKLVSSEKCHVFALRADSSEAKLRQLVFVDKPEVGSENGNKRQTNWTSSLGALLLLFCCSCLVFSTIGLLLLASLRRNPSLRSRFDRLRASLGQY